MFDFFSNFVVIVNFMSNFIFLKKNNENLFNIISEAEKLFRDEYFEQAVIQTRRFAENLCKDLLQEKVMPDETFDSIINRIKDKSFWKSFGNMRMQEFSDDLYFLKKHGNNSAHSSVAVKDGKVALECLERAYEIAIFYSNAKYGYNKKLDKSVFSEEVLMTGKSTASKVLQSKYSTELKKSRTKSAIKSANNKPVKSSKPKKLQKITKSSKKSKLKNKKNDKSKTKANTFLIIFSFILAILIYLFFSINI